MITLFILSTILLFISGILFVPLRIVLNTKQKEYYINLPGYLRADLIFENIQSVKIKLRVLFFTFKIEPGKTRKIKERYRHRETKSQRIKRPVQLLKNQLKNFRITRLNASVDTGNFPLNAQLLPVVNQLNSEKVNIGINFQNQNELDVCIVTRLYKLIYTTIKHKLNNN